MRRHVRVLVTAFLLAAPTTIAVYGQKAPAHDYVRSVRGKVTNAHGAAIAGAVVQITNLKTLQIRSFITKKNGSYMFHRLSTTEDYELKAKHAGRSSSTKTLTRFNTDDPAVVDLKIE